MKRKNDVRIERDVLGEKEVPANVYWGISTQRGIENFKISGNTFPKEFILALAKVKKACLLANLKLGNIDQKLGNAILQAIDEILNQGRFLDNFPVDVFQTGSGTLVNMNMNEVLANRANEILGFPLGKKSPVHPNDHVNMSQSSNDVIPTAMHLATLELIYSKLLPGLKELREALEKKINEFKGIVKVGRTHLQDAVPIPLSTEFMVYEKQISDQIKRIRTACEELHSVPLGGTVVGTGINADRKFSEVAISFLSEITGIPFKANPVKAEGIASHNALVNVSGTLRLLALSLIKMANDIRWMGSGPRAGLGELILPANEPGSSIMPGKINPTQSEALIQVCIQVIGNDTAISFAEGFGSVLDLNVTKPLIIYNLLYSIKILANGVKSFTTHCLTGLRANIKSIEKQLERNLMIVTKLVPIIGYDKAAEIAHKAYETGKSIKEVINELDIKIDKDLDELLDPHKMI